ncbi:hypothetical protein JHK87_038005 [Glycine soja]|nr:hypothetical protein JHK87_038005 [Glycine soja]
MRLSETSPQNLTLLPLSGYLLAMLGDCFVNFVTSNSQKKPKVVELEGGKASQEQHHQARDQCAVAETTNPVLLKTSSVGDTILLILTLCFQSLFEGIAVGVAGTKVEARRNLWTISLQKIFAAIGMGIV